MNSKEIKNLEEALSFMGFDALPTMQELTTRYKKLALEMHPDKNQGLDSAKEKFQRLQQSYQVVGDTILNNVNNVDDKEEEESINIFKVLIKYLFLLWVGAEGKKSSESESDQLNEDSGL